MRAERHAFGFGAGLLILAVVVIVLGEGDARPSTCTAPNAVIALTPDRTGISVQAAPEATKSIRVAYMPAISSTGSEVHYTDIPYPSSTPYVPPAGDPVVDAIAESSPWGATVGSWAGRVATTPAAPRLATGVDLNADTESAQTLAGVALGAKLVRAEFSIDESPAALERLKAKLGPGVEVQPLLGFQGRLPTLAEAREDVRFAIPGVRNVEFGNETPYQVADTAANGEAYGRAAREAIIAFSAKGVGVLVQGGEPSREGPTEWLTGTLRGLGGTRPAGWTVHPYVEATWGGPLTRRLVAGLEAAGDTTTPIYATEWGVATADGVTLSDGTHRTYVEAASMAAREPEALQADAKGRLAQLIVYEAHDLATVGSTSNREEFFGALTLSGGVKEPYTAAIRGLLGG